MHWTVQNFYQENTNTWGIPHVCDISKHFARIFLADNHKPRSLLGLHYNLLNSTKVKAPFLLYIMRYKVKYFKVCHWCWYILKGPAGQTSRDWKAKVAVAALANYLWKAPLERSPNQSPGGNSTPVGAPPKKILLTHVTRKLNSKGCLSGVDGRGALRRLLHEAKFRLGATVSHSRGLPVTTTPEFPRPPWVEAPPPSRALMSQGTLATLASQEIRRAVNIMGIFLIVVKMMFIHRVGGCPWRL